MAQLLRNNYYRQPAISNNKGRQHERKNKQDDQRPTCFGSSDIQRRRAAGLLGGDHQRTITPEAIHIRH